MSDEIKKEQEQPETEKEGGEDLSDEKLEEASGGGLLDREISPSTKEEVRAEDLSKDLTEEELHLPLDWSFPARKI